MRQALSGGFDILQDRADIVARKVLRLLETGHTGLVVALNNALIKEGRFAPAVKMAGESLSQNSENDGLLLSSWPMCPHDGRTV